MTPKHRGQPPAQKAIPPIAGEVKDIARDVEDPVDDIGLSQMSHINTEGFKDGHFNEDQQDEYILMASMYGGISDGFERLNGRRDPWKGFDNLAYALTVTAFVNPDFKARLEVEYPLAYPKVSLKAKLIELQPLQNTQLEADVKQTLTDLPQQRSPSRINNQYLGADDVVEAIIEKLDAAARAFEIAQQGKSLLEIREQEEALLRDHQQAEYERDVARREEEAMQREEQLKQALRREKLRRHDPNAPELQQEQDLNVDEVVADVPFRFNTTITRWNPVEKKVLEFRSVVGSETLTDRVHKKATLVYPVKFGKMHGFPYLLKQIFIPDSISSKQELENAMDEVRRTLEDCKNTDHPLIGKVYAYQIDHDTEDPDMLEWRISILSEFSKIGSLQQSLEVSSCFTAAKVRLYGNQVLQALDFIEKRGYVHPAVHANNVLFFRDAKDEVQIKLSDGYGTKLWELVKRAQRAQNSTNAGIVGWTPPELIKSPFVTTNKTSSWDYGIVLVRMAFMEGHKVEDVLTSPEKLTGRDDLDQAFLQVLISCFQPVPRNRPTAFEIASYNFFKDGSKYINIPTPENPGMEPHLLRSGVAKSLRSTWETKWQIINKLGSGGFGQVYKARNLDDGQYYAVKLLECQTEKDLSDIWAEVKHLAKLGHPGIVRYFNSWSESVDEENETFSPATPRQPRQRAAIPIRSRPTDHIDPVSTGHDFMEPSIHHNIGPEYDSEDDDDDNDLFGYQSPPSDGEYDEEDLGTESEQVIDDMNDLLRQPIESEVSASGGIEFENDGSSEALKTQSGKPKTEKSSHHDRRRSSAARKSILYIQMELCETKTLSTLIKEGLPYRPDQAWTLFKEILRALEHIHSYGIVHRDLKPANIFIGNDRHIKIGDFGLAVTGLADRNSQPLGRENEILVMPQSALGVGTKYYTAPELEPGGSGRYSTKADMFSLGVIFFQMCFPMTTDAERMSNLRGMSEEPDFELPYYFDQESHRAQAAIILRLISHNQDERPSAKELLDGGYLPEDIDLGAVERYLAKMAEDQPEHFQKYMDMAVDRQGEVTRAQELAYLPRGRKTTSRKSRYIIEAVNNQIRDIFQRHGALPTERNNILPARKFYPLAATCVGERGTRLQLPFDLTLPHAAMIAEEQPDFPKSYCFGTVYRTKLDGMQPVTLSEISYDHVSSTAKGLSRIDAEVIKVLDEIVTELPVLAARSLIIYINHGDLLNLILDFCKVPANNKEFVIENLSYRYVRGAGWKELRSKLLDPLQNLPERVVSALSAFNIQGSFEKVRDTINAIFDDDFAGRAARPLTRLEEIFTYLKKLHVQTSVYLAPLSSQAEPLYKESIMYHCVDTKSAKILAVGGRYDKSIEHYRQPEDPPDVSRATGFRINAPLLAVLSSNFYTTAPSSKSKSKVRDTAVISPRLEVVITSFDENTLDGPCFDILQSLLAAGIKAEVSELFSSMEQLDAAYGEPLDYWLVIVRPGASSKRHIKLRSPDREEREVRAIELVGVIKAELEGKASATASEPKLRKTLSSHGGESSAPAPIVLTRKHKSKKTNRMNITDAVTSAAQDAADHINSSAPVVAFAPDSDATLYGLRNTRMGDSDTWKSFRQTVSLDERQYVQELQETLEQLSASGKEGAFIVNYLTNSCIYYDLNKKV